MLFDDGASQVIDFRPVLKGEQYGPLQDPFPRYFIIGPSQARRLRLWLRNGFPQSGVQVVFEGISRRVMRWQ